MSPIAYTLSIATLAAWLSISTGSVIGMLVKTGGDPLAVKDFAKPETLEITEGEFLEADLLAVGSAPSQEVAMEDNEETSARQAETAAEPIPELAAIPELHEITPLPELPEIPLAPSPPSPTPTTPSQATKKGGKNVRGEEGPVAKRTESGSGSGRGSGNTAGSGSGDTGAARFSGGRTPKPAYPPAARRQRIEGIVRVSITIDDGGHVVSCSIASASHPSLNDQGIINTVHGWRFKPGPRATRILPIKFSLEQ